MSCTAWYVFWNELVATCWFLIFTKISLRSWINEKQDGVAEGDMEFKYTHVLHCLNVLRESVMCHGKCRSRHQTESTLI